LELFGINRFLSSSKVFLRAAALLADFAYFVWYDQGFSVYSREFVIANQNFKTNFLFMCFDFEDLKISEKYPFSVSSDLLAV
jgi:hypothetical protein